MRTLYRAGSLYCPSVPQAAALVVEEDRIAWVGSREAAAHLAEDVDAVVDLGDALITPGFVDAHVHVTETGLLLGGVDLRPARSVPQILAMVEDAARAAPGHAVLGHGWDETLLAQGRPPTRAELDRAADGAVVYLSRVDVHSAVISTALAQACGAAGRIGWDDDGRVERDAHHAAREATREALSTQERRAAQREALRAAAAAGIVAVHEMSGPHIAPEADLRTLVALAADPGEVLPSVTPYWAELVATPEQARQLPARLGVQVAGLAGDLCVDGSVGSRTAAYRQEYADAPGTSGHLYLSVEQIRDHVAACTATGLQAGFHAIGDAAVDAVRRGIRRAAERVGIAAVRRARHRVEHVESIDAEGIADLADLGVTACVQPAFDALWGGPDGLYATRLGQDRARAMNPLAALVRGRVPLSFGSDAPVTPFDPWGTIRAGVQHRTPEQRITAQVALTAHTVGGWRPLGQPADWVSSAASFAAWSVSAPLVDGLPDLAPELSLPRCLLTVHGGRVLHDALS